MPITYPFHVYMGYDKREVAAYEVAEYSLNRRASCSVKVVPLKASDLSTQGFLHRTVVIQNGQMWDVISEAPQSTEFAISRFLTPILHKKQTGKSGWALFVDCDVLFLDDIANLLPLLDDTYAVMCVKHSYTPTPGMKMDSQAQTLYRRKNWSSVMAFNCDHPSNDKLTIEMVNSLPGRDLHRFCWLQDEEIGPLPKEWNALIGEPGYDIETAKIAHYTRGGPWFEPFYGDTSGLPLSDQIWLDEESDMFMHKG
jgi:hypothetical protein